MPDSYPQKPITIVVPGLRGGPSDVLARTIAKILIDAWGQSVEIENAHALVALQAGAQAAPDGYTLIMGGGTFFIHANMYRKLPFDPFGGFAPVCLIAIISNVLVIHPWVPADSVSSLIAYAKANPGKLTYASSGTYDPPHLAGELFNKMAGVNMGHKTFKGHVAAGPALCEGREVQLMYDAMLTAVPHIEAGELKALAVTTAKRSQILPDLPTIAESGLPGYDITVGMGVMTPAGTPIDVRRKLSATISAGIQADAVKAQLRKSGIEAQGSSPEEFGAFIKNAFEMWGSVIRRAEIPVLDSPPLT